MTADQVIRTEDERDALPPGTVLRAVDSDGNAEWWMAYVGMGGGTSWVGITVDPEWGHDTEHKPRYMTLPAVVVSTPSAAPSAAPAPWDDVVEPREPKHRKPSPPPCCEPTEAIEGTWLVERHDHCTCGAGGPWGHEPGCTLVPLVNLATLDGWTPPWAPLRGALATARRDALNDAADAFEGAGRVYGYAVAVDLRARAAQEEGR